jgi:plastocyanin
MSRNQRIGLLAAAAIVVIVAVVVAIASGGGDGNGSAGTTPGTSTEQPHETLPADNLKIQIKGEKPVGGIQNFKVKKGDKVTLVVSADAHDVIHLHGYDIEKDIEPGKPATFRFTANQEGVFEIESHVAEHEGKPPLMAKLSVEPD